MDQVKVKVKGLYCKAAYISSSPENKDRWIITWLIGENDSWHYGGIRMTFKTKTEMREFVDKLVKAGNIKALTGKEYELKLEKEPKEGAYTTVNGKGPFDS
jgi:hypothetical protein